MDYQPEIIYIEEGAADYAMTRRVLFHVQHLLGIGHLRRVAALASACASCVKRWTRDGSAGLYDDRTLTATSVSSSGSCALKTLAIPPRPICAMIW